MDAPARNAVCELIMGVTCGRGAGVGKWIVGESWLFTRGQALMQEEQKVWPKLNTSQKHRLAKRKKGEGIVDVFKKETKMPVFRIAQLPQENVHLFSLHSFYILSGIE